MITLLSGVHFLSGREPFEPSNFTLPNSATPIQPMLGPQLHLRRLADRLSTIVYGAGEHDDGTVLARGLAQACSADRTRGDSDRDASFM